MKLETCCLSADRARVTLSSYVLGQCKLGPPPRPAILILPGGGYDHHSPREGEPVAQAFLAQGFNAYVLHYSVGEDAVFPRPLTDASRAMVYIRAHAAEHHTDPERVFVIGFSAGGHLAAALGTLWHTEEAKASPDMPEGINRPTGMLLCYPVISGGEWAHLRSFRMLLGKSEPTEEELRRYSLELRVDENTVPAYIWHTLRDEKVPVQNALLLASAMAAHRIPVELHVFPRGPHGLALATPETNGGKPVSAPECATWLGEAIDWIARLTPQKKGI